MALIKTDNSIVSIKGRFGGVYFKTGKDGMHIQAMPRYWNYTRSPAQQGKWGPGSGFMSFGIDGFSGMAALWLLPLLVYFAVNWTLFSFINRYVAPNNEDKHLTGWNWYVRFALAFPELEHPPLWKPPHSPTCMADYMVTFRGTWMYGKQPKDWPAECGADYYYKSIFWNGRASFKNDDSNWYIWWKDPMWVISPHPGVEPAGMTSYGVGDEIRGEYINPVSGFASQCYYGSVPD